MKLKTVFILLTITALFYSFSLANNEEKQINQAEEKKQIEIMLDNFNVAAANYEYQKYFDYYTEDAAFMGTDATEYWDKKSFMLYAKPYFDKKSTWDFTAIDRHIYFAKSGEVAWFDELLKTQMKICRGSGVVVKIGGRWKVQQYVLSMTIPNSLSASVIKLKTNIEDSIIDNLNRK